MLAALRVVDGGRGLAWWWTDARREGGRGLAWWSHVVVAGRETR